MVLCGIGSLACTFAWCVSFSPVPPNTSAFPPILAIRLRFDSWSSLIFSSIKVWAMLILSRSPLPPIPSSAVETALPWCLPLSRPCCRSCMAACKRLSACLLLWGSALLVLALCFLFIRAVSNASSLQVLRTFNASETTSG